MKSTIFKYIDREKDNTLVLIPGWATDYRIFESLNFNFNYIIPIRFSTFNFKKSLLDFLEYKKIEKISLFGYSLGGFIANDFAINFPELIDELILVSIRRKYKKETLEEIEKLLKKNKKAFLYKFYRELFNSRENFLRYKELFKYYCNNLNLEDLIDGLLYLKEANINPIYLNKIKKIKIIHGEPDKIAPIEEAIYIKNRLKHIDFFSFKDAGHLVFLEKNIEYIL